MKTISEVGLKLIKSFEGCSLIAYDDLQPKAELSLSSKIIGTLTIGWGHTGNVKIGQTITQSEADSLLLTDMIKYIGYVNNPSYVPLTKQLNQNQFDALVSFCYNCGQGNLKTLCANRSLEQISNKLLEYNKSKGNVLTGLVRRREAEKQLFDKKETKPIEQNNLESRIAELEENVKKIIIALTTVADSLAIIPPPDWFVKEFPNALNLINDKTGTKDFWRAFAIALRIIK